MFERFTDRARRVIVLTQEESRALNHGYLGTEHLLLGLIAETEGVAAQVLTAQPGVSLDAARQLAAEITEPGDGSPRGHIPFTPRCKKCLELSLRESLSLGHNYIGTEHVLLGLIREGEGVGAQILVKLGVDLSELRHQVIALLTGGERAVAPRSVATVNDPVFIRHEPYGTVTVEWPDPPRRTYDVAHEALAQYVETLNRIATLTLRANSQPTSTESVQQPTVGVTHRRDAIRSERWTDSSRPASPMRHSSLLRSPS